MNSVGKLEELLSAVLADYCSFFDEIPISIQVIITDNMLADYKKKRPDHIKSGKLDIKTIDSYNGITIPPASNDEFTILLNLKYVLDTIQCNKMDCIGTFAHEVTHVYDFRGYKELSGCDYDEMMDYSKNRMFIIWTEFNAKVKGYLFLRKYTFQRLQDRSQVNDIVSWEMPGLLQYMVSEYGKTTNADRQLYVISHFLAHFYVWQRLFPDTFTDNMLCSIFSENPWLRDLYSYLKEHRTLESAYPTFDQMKDILSANFSGL